MEQKFQFLLLQGLAEYKGMYHLFLKNFTGGYQGNVTKLLTLKITITAVT